MPTTSWRRIIRTTVIAAVAGALSLGVLPGQQAEAATPKYKIAVLGDSWASGEGNAPYSDVNCDRSKDAWSYQVTLPDGNTVREDLSAGTASLDFLACTGAVTANLIDTPQKVDGITYPVQIPTMGDDATHVFLSISGNDFNFAGLLASCVGPSTTCTANIDSTRNTFPAVLKQLSAVIEKIHKRVPQAQIILTGYAPPVGYKSAWAENSGYLNLLASDYDDGELAVVKSLQKKGIDVDFVHLFAAFDFHAYGDKSSSYFFPPTFSISPLRLSKSSLHPNGAGEIAIARLVTKVVEKPYTGSCSGNVKQGMTGNCVREIQAHYNAWATSLSPDGPKISVDGDFGPATLAAVKRFQKAKKLTVDGIVGPATKKALFNY